MDIKTQIAWIITDEEMRKILTFAGNRLDPIYKLNLNEHIFWDKRIAESRNKFLHGQYIIKEVKVTLEVTEE